MVGAELPQKWTDFNLSENTSDGNLICGNLNFIAASWNAAHSPIAILDINNPIRVPSNVPLIRAHKAYINDLKFSPFIPNLLASCSDDGTIKFWQIPEGGLTKDLDKETQIYRGHHKRVILSQFHPCSRDIMGSCSFDNSIQVFSITTGKTYCKVTTKDRISSLDWNYNGSLIGIMNSDKNAYIYDPRGNKEVLHTKAHGSQKCQKMVFVDPNYFSTTGFDNGKREIKLFDMRNFEKPVNTLIIDSSSGVMFPFYDYDSHCIFIPGRGEQTIYFYAFNEGNISKLNDEYKMPISPKSFGMLEKCFVDYENCEMTRLLRWDDNALGMTSLRVLRQNGFDPDLYPATFIGESALSGDEWASGVDKDQIKGDITKRTENKNTNVKIIKSEDPDELKAEIARLNEELKKKDEEIAKLKEELEEKKIFNK